MTQEWKICREELEFLANTLIFVLSGVIITGKIWESSTTSSLDYIRPADYGYAVLLWVYLLVCDFFRILCIFSPVCRAQRSFSAAAEV